VVDDEVADFHCNWIADVKESTERDRGLLGLVERIMGRPAPPEPARVAVNPDSSDGLAPVVAAQASAPASLEPQISVEATRTLSHAEMADVILRGLRAVQGCPEQGFEVIVYGSRPWNAMLRITPAAGPLPDAAAWRARVRDLVPLLRAQYELVE
jgi:hypothetical protein